MLLLYSVDVLLVRGDNRLSVDRCASSEERAKCCDRVLGRSVLGCSSALLVMLLCR